jgi:hypothetical protein
VTCGLFATIKELSGVLFGPMIRLRLRLALLGLFIVGLAVSAVAQNAPLAPTPPMGWNSYDAFGGLVNEDEFRNNAKFVADKLAKYGYNYVVVDYYWYFDQASQQAPGGITNEQNVTSPAMDEYGRLLPAVERFPSAANGRGFKPLADYVHGLGLKFGLHIMRGIPRAAVAKNLPVLGTNVHAADVANQNNKCAWSAAMFGVDTTKPGGQAYYDSIVKLYADWGVDFIKADDMSAADPKATGGLDYHGDEIEALRKAIDKTGRAIVLSLSPGPTPLAQTENVARFAQMWRISDDIWDDWKLIAPQFERCRQWAQYSKPGNWPDADMLPLGLLRVKGFEGQRTTRLTPDEQTTLMTLWSIFRSPLMVGADLWSADPFTVSLLTNEEVLAVDQQSSGNHELSHAGSRIVWVADAADGRSKYVALFNVGEASTLNVGVSFAQIGIAGRAMVRDLWQKADVGVFSGAFQAAVPRHGAKLLRITPAPEPAAPPQT